MKCFPLARREIVPYLLKSDEAAIAFSCLGWRMQAAPNVAPINQVRGAPSIDVTHWLRLQSLRTAPFRMPNRRAARQHAITLISVALELSALAPRRVTAIAETESPWLEPDWLYLVVANFATAVQEQRWALESVIWPCRTLRSLGGASRLGGVLWGQDMFILCYCVENVHPTSLCEAQPISCGAKSSYACKPCMPFHRLP